MKVIKTLVSFCTKPFTFFRSKRKMGAKKYIVTDAGGRGDLTRLTHRYHLWIVSIRGKKSEVILCSKNPNCTNTYTLEELQEFIPGDSYIELGHILAQAQQKRDSCEQQKRFSPVRTQ